ncbi:MAG: type II toxin-antitoxin system Phd/YefM family antitoxin [Methylibium sp.]|nr:type II toxin-antitoxin system Phd/YefM family antitoxin [Methylibium sp.]
MQVNMLEAKTQLSRLVEAALRGEEVVIANRGRAVVKLVKIETPPKRIAGAWAGLMTDAEIEHAFSPEVDAELAREWLQSIDKPIDAGLKPRRRAAKKVARKPAR